MSEIKQNGNEFAKLYTLQSSDESITPFANEAGFSLIRCYPKDTPYHKDGRRMFIKIAAPDRGFFYSVEMTRPEKEGEKTRYIITEGEEYKRKITNFFSDGSEFTFDNATRKVNHRPSNKSFTINEFVEILVENHLSDKLFFKRILNELANKVLKFLFWLSDARYERVRTAIDKYNYSKGEKLPKDKKKNIEPFFKYFYISKNILFTFLLVTFPSAIFFGYLWAYGDFSLSNPSLLLLLFLILFSCEKFSIWLDKKIKEFLIPSKDHFTEEKINFIEKLHDYQYNNKFQLKMTRSVIFLILLIIFVLVLPAIFYFDHLNLASSSSAIRDLSEKEESVFEENNQSTAPDDDGFDCECEEEFEEPIDVVWSGRIFANLVGGIDYGIEKLPRDEEYPVFYAGQPSDVDESRQWLSGRVEVRGKWTGITCAYRNTIFGRCVPYVEIENIYSE